MSLDHLNGAAFQLKAGMQHENVTRAKQLIEQLTKVFSSDARDQNTSSSN